MINRNDATTILEIVPPPELHLLLGPVNTLYKAMEVWPNSKEWLDSCYVKQTDNHGGVFEGNDCKSF